MTSNNPESVDQELSAESIQAALDAVVSSDIFDGSTRLQEFLTYVVKASIEGKHNKIPAKVISEDVYKRTITTSADNENVVRVDAGRLRRRLEQYYLDAGKNDPVRIHMDPGGYVPRFEARNFLEEPGGLPTPNRRRIVFGALVFLCIIAVGIIFNILWINQENWISAENDQYATKTNNIKQRQKVIQRKAVMEKSQVSLQAINLAEQTRGLIFPIFDLERIKLANRLFGETIKKDKEYFGGYAGVAQTLGVMALLAPSDQNRNNFLVEAQQFAEKAVSLSPTNSWAQSAAAWVAFVSRNYDQATRLSKLAIEINSEDRDALDFHGLISLFTGDFEAALEASDPNRFKPNPNRRYDSQNIYGVVNFHLGHYAKTIASLNSTAETGGPVGAPSLVFLVAAHQAMGNLDKAMDIANDLMATWPDFHAEVVMRKLYQHPEHANAVISQLQAAGWISPKQN